MTIGTEHGDPVELSFEDHGHHRLRCTSAALARRPSRMRACRQDGDGALLVPGGGLTGTDDRFTTGGDEGVRG
jgi:hypothetical protein